MREVSPPKHPPVQLEELVGWDADKVRGVLGPPDHDQPGRHWYSPSLFSPLSAVTRGGLFGTMKRVKVFGLVPRTIPVGVEYRTWRYENLSPGDWPETWHLYLIQTRGTIPSEAEQPVSWLTSLRNRLGFGPRRWVVVETASHPLGKVF